MGNQPGHKYEYQHVGSNDGRFAYDGALPKINSKYRKQSVDIDISKLSPRADPYKKVIEDRHDRQYEVSFKIVTPRTLDIQMSPRLKRHSELRKSSEIPVFNERQELVNQTKGIASKGAPLRLLKGAAAYLQAVNQSELLNRLDNDDEPHAY